MHCCKISFTVEKKLWSKIATDCREQDNWEEAEKN
jgi:hypothetical protein